MGASPDWRIDEGTGMPLVISVLALVVAILAAAWLRHRALKDLLNSENDE